MDGRPGEPAPLRAELMAAAVVAAHNHVLRRWLRGESPNPMAEVDQALRQVIELFTTAGGDPAPAPTGPRSSPSAPARTSRRCSRPCGASLITSRRALPKNSQPPSFSNGPWRLRTAGHRPGRRGNGPFGHNDFDLLRRART